MNTRDSIELELLLLRCKRGDPAAQEQLVRRFERPLFYFIRRIVQNEANAWDALQNTWIRVLEGLTRGSQPVSPVPWLYRIARNTSLNFVRDERRHQVDSELREVESTDERFDCDDAEEIHAALDQLPLSDRESLTLHFLDQLSIREIGDVLGVPEGTIKSRIHFAKKRLRQILENRK